jgi:ABC-type Zn uptake system ZnuABC Zn-binding protein ZnuA
VKRLNPFMRVAAAVLLLVCAVLAGCGRNETPTADEPIHAVASVYVLGDIIKQIGGDQVNVDCWVEDGQSLNDLVETPARRQQVRSAELLVTRGAADPWTLVGVGSAYQDRRVIRVDSLPSARDADPTHYIWLDPRTAMELADEVAARLSTIRPSHEQQFKANAAKFTRRVAELMEPASKTINRESGGGPIVTLDRGFLPLANRFGMSEVKVPNIVLTNPTSYNVKQLRGTATDAGAGAIFLSSETPAPLLREWQAQLGMPVLALDPMGTSNPTGRSTYIAVLSYNLDQLAEAASRSKPLPQVERYPQPPPEYLKAPDGLPTTKPQDFNAPRATPLIPYGPERPSMLQQPDLLPQPIVTLEHLKFTQGRKPTTTRRSAFGGPEVSPVVPFGRDK